MPDDESIPSDAPEGRAEEHPAGAAESTTTPPEGATDDAPMDDAARRRIAELSKENAAARRRLRELEEKVAAEERAKLSDLERLAADAADAKAALEQERAERARERRQSAIVAESARQRAVDPDAVWAIVRDDALAAEEFDAAKLVTATLKAKPYLVARPTTGSDADPARSHQGERRETDQQMRSRIRGSNSIAAFFDPKRAAERGGGVRYLGRD